MTEQPPASSWGGRLHAPLDVLIVWKIDSPWQPEFAIGAVTDVDGRPECVFDRGASPRCGSMIRIWSG